MRTCSPTWRIPRRTAQTVRWSSDGPGAGLPVRDGGPGDGAATRHGADVGAHAGIGAGLVPETSIGRASDAWWAMRVEAALLDKGRPTIDWSTLAESHCRTRRSASGPGAVPRPRGHEPAQLARRAGRQRGGWSAARTSRTRSCRAVARGPARWRGPPPRRARRGGAARSSRGCRRPHRRARRRRRGGASRPRACATARSRRPTGRRRGSAARRGTARRP